MIGKSIANRPYMYLPLKGDTNDYSTNAQNPTNSGVSSTTGQFGESNGAYDWDNGDYLEWSDAIGDTIVDKMNIASVVCFFANVTASNAFNIFLSKFGGASNRAFQYYSRDDGSLTDGLQANYYTNATTAVAADVANVLNINNFKFYVFKTLENGSNLDVEITDLTSSGSSTIAKIYTGTSANLRIGYRVSGSGDSDYSMHTFRIYDVTLSNGALKILNNEKGRIRA